MLERQRERVSFRRYNYGWFPCLHKFSKESEGEEAEKKRRRARAIYRMLLAANQDDDGDDDGRFVVVALWMTAIIQSEYFYKRLSIFIHQYSNCGRYRVIRPTWEFSKVKNLVEKEGSPTRTIRASVILVCPSDPYCFLRPLDCTESCVLLYCPLSRSLVRKGSRTLQEMVPKN